MSLYRDLLDADCSLDNHESDLYVKLDTTSARIVKASGATYTSFRSQIDGCTWLDVPFAYEPFWEARRQKSEPPRVKGSQ